MALNQLWYRSTGMKSLRQERGQGSIEYLLVVATVVVLVVGAMTVGFAALMPQVAGLVCPAVDTASAAAPNSCLGP